LVCYSTLCSCSHFIPQRSLLENNVGLLVSPHFLLFDIHILIMNYNCSTSAFYKPSLNLMCDLTSLSLYVIYSRYLNHATHSMSCFLIFTPSGSYSSSVFSPIVWITPLYLLRFRILLFSFSKFYELRFLKTSKAYISKNISWAVN
jgi:hypothetical protein